MSKLQRGFTVIEILIALVVIVAIAFGGYYIYHRDHKTSVSSSSFTTSQPALNDSNSKVIKLGGGIATFRAPSNWVVLASASGTTSCIHNPSGDPVNGCFDGRTIYLKSEKFTNSDQFFATVGIYKKTTATDLVAWTNNIIGGLGIASSDVIHEANGQSKIIADPMSPSSSGPIDSVGSSATYDATVLSKSKKYIVYVRSDLFNGDHYSYKTSKDYFPYHTDLTNIIDSVQISQ